MEPVVRSLPARPAAGIPFSKVFVEPEFPTQVPMTVSVFQESLAGRAQKISVWILFQLISRLFQFGLLRVFASLR
jgi:hypothetical protein